MKTLDIKEKQKVSYCIPNDLRDEQIKINIANVKGRIEPVEELRTEPIAIVCFGPSLNETWEEIKKFKYIMTCSGAHKFLLDKGLDPNLFEKWWHIDVDPREHKIKLLGQPHPKIEYLGASTCHPKYFKYLEGYNVKLWHVFANEDEAYKCLPRDEWWLTGGSSVGLRCLTIARFFGFVDHHIFGMDGSFREDVGKHAAEHPNQPKEQYETECNGKKFWTTPSVLHCAQETFNELDQLKDVKPTFYGEGLVQEMAKDYKPKKPKYDSLIAYNKPGLISKEHLELNRKLHEDTPSYGMGGAKHKDVVIKLLKSAVTEENPFPACLDYGSGKGMLAKSLSFPIAEYDPAIPGKDSAPNPADVVVCTDVLEHIEPKKLDIVLDDLRRVTKQVGYFVIATRQAVKTYSNGQNTHLIVENKDWWTNKLKKFFKIESAVDAKGEVHFFVRPKVQGEPEGEQTQITDGTTKVSFLTPNDTTRWRAKTLFTKEPSTIEWINSMKEGEVMFDIGANVGSYTVWAGAKGMKVYAFEPEAENYALLVKNMNLNKIVPNAYCMAITESTKSGLLYESTPEPGAACHTFGKEVGFDLQPRKSIYTQGSIGLPLDTLVYEFGLPSPNHLKIDVDGLEYDVIKGAQKVLQNGLESLLVEVNPSLEEHQQMVKHLADMGYTFDPEQVKKAERKEGTFKGCAEYIFRREKQLISLIPVEEPPETDEYISEMVKNAAIELEPFNYLYVENLFPSSIYSAIQTELEKAKYIEIEKSRGTRGYPLRYTASPNTPFWQDLQKAMLSGKFKKALLDKFGIEDKGNLIEDLLLIRDLPGYQISPHTDAVRKVITVLIYLPEDELAIKEGTSIFEPNQKGFTCDSGKHNEFKDFKEVFRAPFKPNSALVFARTDNSFHGVFPSKHIRNVLLYNINKK